VVGEFPEVQGVMGRYYAGFDGEPGDVPAAIAEHYLPRFQGDAIPRTLAGTVVALADKLDSIVGAFALGLEPSGSQDPYALRRQAIGVIRILTQDDPTPAFTPFDLEARRLIEAAADTFGPGVVKDHAALADKVADFLTGRFRVMLAEQGRDANLIAAVLGTASTGFTDLGLRLKALEAISGSPDFAPMLIAFKRVMNISKDHAATEYSAAAFAHQTERDLAAAFEAMAGRFDAAMQARAYDAALNEIVGLKPAIDRFFDDVLVMDPDPAVRANRLGLVRAIADRFRRFADFARVQG
jgi:glycyl-tRNA synthetase beta chain